MIFETVLLTSALSGVAGLGLLLLGSCFGGGLCGISGGGSKGGAEADVKDDEAVKEPFSSAVATPIFLFLSTSSIVTSNALLSGPSCLASSEGSCCEFPRPRPLPDLPLPRPPLVGNMP